MNAIINTIQANAHWVGQILQGDLSARHTTAMVLFAMCNLVIFMVVAHDAVNALRRHAR
jgi:hypothetical protein